MIKVRILSIHGSSTKSTRNLDLGSGGTLGKRFPRDEIRQLSFKSMGFLEKILIRAYLLGKGVMIGL